jgi:predicted peptidase
MTLLLLAALLTQAPASPPGRVQNKTIEAEGVGTITYGISVPSDYRPDQPRPLILALHPGGARMAYYGSQFMRQIVLPALGDLRAIVVAPDCLERAWGDAKCDQAVTTLLRKIQDEYAIDRRRVLVTGFSMGGRGTWFMASHHPDVFTAAIPMAASTGDEPVDRLAKMPTYVIHSRDDERVPFAPAEKNARELEKLGRTIRFEELQGVGHFSMGGYIDALRRAGRWVEERWAK